MATEVTPVEPPWWRQPKGSRRREPLSRDAIVDAAMRVLDSEGVDALSVRRLAAELGTGPATLYWHISGVGELGELIYDRIMGEIPLPDPDPKRWQAQVKDMVRHAYQAMLRHNDAVRLSLGRVPVGPNALRVVEWSLDLTRRAGIPDQAAVYFGDIIGRYIDASVLEVSTPMYEGGPDGAALAGYFSGLSKVQFPNVVAVLSRAAFEPDDDERFEFGLDLLITGLAAHVKAGPKKRGGTVLTKGQRRRS